MAEPQRRPLPQVSSVDDAEWPQQVAGMIVDGVGTVRDKTTKPIMTASRWAVYGTLAALLGLVILLLLFIAGIRVVTEGLQWLTGEQDIVWLTYLLLGGMLCGAGAFCWSRRSPR